MMGKQIYYPPKNSNSGLLSVFFWIGLMLISIGVVSYGYWQVPLSLAKGLIEIGLLILLVGLGILIYFIFTDPDRVRSEKFLLEKEKLKKNRKTSKRKKV